MVGVATIRGTRVAEAELDNATRMDKKGETIKRLLQAEAEEAVRAGITARQAVSHLSTTVAMAARVI
jgi:hypothetical protein